MEAQLRLSLCLPSWQEIGGRTNIRSFDLGSTVSHPHHRLSRITPPRGSVPHTQRSTSQNATQSHPTEGEATENVNKYFVSLTNNARAHLSIQAPTEVHAILSQKPRRKKKERREGYYGPPPNCPIGKMFQTRCDWCGTLGIT